MRLWVCREVAGVAPLHPTPQTTVTAAPEGSVRLCLVGGFYPKTEKAGGGMPPAVSCVFFSFRLLLPLFCTVRV